MGGHGVMGPRTGGWTGLKRELPSVTERRRPRARRPGRQGLACNRHPVPTRLSLPSCRWHNRPERPDVLKWRSTRTALKDALGAPVISARPPGRGLLQPVNQVVLVITADRRGRRSSGGGRERSGEFIVLGVGARGCGDLRVSHARLSGGCGTGCGPSERFTLITRAQQLPASCSIVKQPSFNGRCWSNRRCRTLAVGWRMLGSNP
jgi:hypothetical protein